MKEKTSSPWTNQGSKHFLNFQIIKILKHGSLWTIIYFNAPVKVQIDHLRRWRKKWRLLSLEKTVFEGKRCIRINSHLSLTDYQGSHSSNRINHFKIEEIIENKNLEKKTSMQVVKFVVIENHSSSIEIIVRNIGRTLAFWNNQNFKGRKNQKLFSSKTPLQLMTCWLRSLWKQIKHVVTETCLFKKRDRSTLVAQFGACRRYGFWSKV